MVIAGEEGSGDSVWLSQASLATCKPASQLAEPRLDATSLLIASLISLSMESGPWEVLKELDV